MIPPWRVLASRILHRDRWLHVRADHCVSASGATLDPYYVLHYSDWVNILAITEDGLVVTIRQYRHGVGRVVHELPGGMIDAGETPQHAAARELLEETGYAAASIRPVCAHPANPATHTNTIHSFLALGARKTSPTAHEAGEDLVVELVTPAALLHAVRADQFGQAMQAGAIILALEAAGALRLDLCGDALPTPLAGIAGID